MPPPIKASQFEGNLADFLEHYKYQPALTLRLDRLKGTGFTRELVNEIVLWKVNRFVQLGCYVLRDIEGVKELKPREHRQAEPVIASLLKVHGVDLPMASTLLRFRNPTVFQIIDRHSYRAVYGSDYPLYTQTSVKRKIGVYFTYLDGLHSICEQKGLKFETVDRVLYVFDKKINGDLAKGKNADE